MPIINRVGVHNLVLTDQISNTAILVFSRSAKAESREKNIFSSHRKGLNKRVFQSFLNHSLQVARNSQLQVFWVDEKKQQGSTFGERLANAFEYVFDHGFQNVISIGNDTPELCYTDLQRAAESLIQQKAVLGPTADGGDYLIGLNKSSFCKETFQNIPWQTDAVNDSLIQHFNAMGCEVEFMQTLEDVDHESVIWNSSKHQAKLHGLKILLQQLLSYTTLLPTYFSKSIRSVFLFQKGLRAPPHLS